MCLRNSDVNAILDSVLKNLLSQKNLLKTLIIRHRKENKKKCTLEPIRHRPDCIFLNYPGCQLPNLEGYILLSFEGPPLSKKDTNQGIILVDGTWNKACLMEKQLFQNQNIKRRSLPSNLVTAYPRKQTGCSNPDQGLASIEALYVAYLILGKDATHLLDHYYWKEAFLEKNAEVLRYF